MAEEEKKEPIFKEELQAIEEAIKEMDDLYEETKSHFDMVKQSGHQRSLSFIHLQTSNLISLKNAKLSMLKEKASLKKAGIELDLKTKTPEDQVNGDLIKEMYKMIINSNDIQTANEYDEDEEDEEDDIDSILAKRVAQVKAKKEENDKAKTKTKSETSKHTDSMFGNVKIVVQVKDKKWKFVAIDEDGNIVKDAELPNKKDHKIKLKKVDGVKVAVDQDGRVFDLI